ncbi:30S ribosomal protein S16 [Fodinibius salsisoli]|uniref:Small ribosomal subunit protein bS16 n=1 Tax=Fodinibius salsisoli TaxID=2820877 RepID=A0ABT3PLQ9_9BACT|nr:30S ribosomal protein S16 [Fodinibius salsisoli]MCW9706890.1 30S ribosomal protein S16 [Fodinibius salsisoli]
MLRIRLQRRGRKKRPIHHIVVADSRKPRDGRIIEDLGRFDNITPKNELDLKRDRALYWLKQGAQPSDTVRSIFKKQGLMYEMHLIRWGKSEEEIEAALTEWREKREAKEEDVPTRKERQKALLEAEEKEFQKQLKKKAEEAAREKAKQEALAAEEDEEQEEDDEEEEIEASDDEEAAAEEVQAQETEAEEQEAEADTAEEEDTQEAAAEEDSDDEVAADSDDAEEEASEEDEAEAESDEEEEVEASEEDADEEEESDEDESEVKAKVSTDMLAKEAIEYIENTPLDELEGFVTEDEDRVTVQRALEDKQEQDEEE